MTKNLANKTFLPGDFVFREGEFGKVAYVIEEGEIELVKFTGDEYITLAEISKGALFGEMAIIDGSPRSGSARAKTSCTLREVTEEQLKQHLSASPQTSLDMMRRLAGYARSANEKLNRDAFEDNEKVNADEISEIKNKSQKREKIDEFTNKTLKEFNDDIDQFSDINPNRSLFVSGIVIILIVTAFVIWSSVTSIDITVATRGQISTEIPNVNVQSNYDSVIKRILVKEGDRVEAGQILAKFDETLLASDIRDTEIKLKSNNDNLIRTQAELAYLNDKDPILPIEKIQLAIFKGFSLEVDTTKNVNKNNLNQLNVDLKIIRNEISELNSKLTFSKSNVVETISERIYMLEQVKSYLSFTNYKSPLKDPSKTNFEIMKSRIDAKLDLLNSELHKINTDYQRALKLIKNQIISNQDFMEAEQSYNKKKNERDLFVSEEIQILSDEIIGLKKELKVTKFKFKNKLLNQAKLKAQIEDAQVNHETYLNQMRKKKNEELKSLIDNEIAMREKLIKLKRNQRDVELLSPISGTILKLEDNFEGSVVEPGDGLLTIVPENVDIHVLIDIDPKNITNVYEGAKVKILLDAMPSQKHGELVGKLISISKDTRDEDISGEKGNKYRGKVKIIENNLRNTPKDFTLLPGMNVSGNVISGTRPLITYLIYPVIKTINTAMREP